MAESAIVFDTASTLTANTRTLHTHHFGGTGALPLTVHTHHMDAAEDAVSRAIVIPAYHLSERVARAVVLPAYHRADVVVRYISGVHFLGTEGRSVVEADEGAIPSGTGADDGATTKTLPKGVGHGTIGHLGSVVYAEPYQGTPFVAYVGGGLTMEQRAKWGTKAAVDAGTASSAAPTASGIYQVPVFEGDASGFTARLYLRNSATLTAQTAVMDAPTTLTALGTTGTTAPAAADLPAFDDTYSAAFSVTLDSAIAGSAQITLQLEARLDGGAWSAIGQVKKTHTFKAGGATQWSFAGTLTGVISGMDGAGQDQFRCRVFSVSSPTGEGSSATFSVTFGPNVTWNKGDPQYASMTPEPGDEVSFVVIGATSSA